MFLHPYSNDVLCAETDVRICYMLIYAFIKVTLCFFVYKMFLCFQHELCCPNSLLFSFFSVTLSGTGGAQFKGYVIVARQVNGNTDNIGNFSPTPNSHNVCNGSVSSESTISEKYNHHHHHINNFTV